MGIEIAAHYALRVGNFKSVCDLYEREDYDVLRKGLLAHGNGLHGNTRHHEAQCSGEEDEADEEEEDGVGTVSIKVGESGGGHCFS